MGKRGEERSRNRRLGKHWGEGRAVYRRADVPNNGESGSIISSDEDHQRISDAVGAIYADARRAGNGRPPSFLR